jgi:hypothetical protein
MRLRTVSGIHISSPKEISGTYSWKLSSHVASRTPLSWNNVEHYIFKHVRKIAESGYWLCHVCLSVCLSMCLHGTTRLPYDGFLRNFILEDFSKICPENSCFTKIWQKWVLYMKTNILVHFWSYLALLRMRNISGSLFIFNNFLSTTSPLMR